MFVSSVPLCVIFIRVWLVGVGGKWAIGVPFFGFSKRISESWSLLFFAMATIMFETPTICENCGAHNFKIHGVIYNGDLNYSLVTVKCMRCGTIAENIRKENNQT